MAIVKPTLATPGLSGKTGGIVYATQPDGTVIARGVGKRKAPFTPGEKRGQERMKLAHQYLRGALADPALRAAYEEEARRINARTRSVAIADFLTDPVIDGIDDTLFTGAAGCCLLVVTGNEFKVVRVSVEILDALGRLVDYGEGERVMGNAGRVWVYEQKKPLPPGQPVTLQVRAFDRPGHCAALTITKVI